MRAALWVVVVAAVHGACGGLLPSTRLEAVFPATDRRDVLPVVVDDPAGFVRAIAVGLPPGLDFTGDDGPFAVLGRPATAVMIWTGGACDRKATLSIRPSTDRIDVSVATQATFGCESIGIFRAVTLELAEPIGTRTLVGVEAPRP